MKTREETGVGGEKSSGPGATRPRFEDQILTALAEAGVDGLDREALLDAVLGEQDVELLDERACNTMISELIVRGFVHVRTEGVHMLTLSHAEWARRLIHDAIIPITEHCTAALTSVLDGQQVDALQAEFERMLSGSDSTKLKDVQ